MKTQPQLEPIAIVGMSLRVPGAKTLEDFWRNLCQSVDSVSDFSEADTLAAGVPLETARDPNYVKSFGALEDIDLFDAPFFGFSRKEAALLDPQQRLFLECAHEALEHAGHAPSSFQGRIGVFAGAALSTYLLRNLLPRQPFHFSTPGRLEMMMANHKDMMPAQAAYRLNLTGPTLNISCACSSSLAAAHLACQQLRLGEADLMLAGGAHIRIPQTEGYLYQPGLRFAPDGRCHPFDARARGFVSASGVGVVALKRWADARADGNEIYALLLGSALGNDGGGKLSFTAPSRCGIAETAARALRQAGLAAADISFVEAHGTATEIGDPIEINALAQAYGHAQPSHCLLGSVKANIGYTQHASGVIGLIKTALCLRHRQIPPLRDFQSPNPKIGFGPFRVNTALEDWRSAGAPRRAGINNFGVGGVNVHVILEEAPSASGVGRAIANPTQLPAPQATRWQLAPLSAKTPAALRQAAANLAAYLLRHPDADFADVAHTLRVGREAFGHRKLLLCRNREEALRALKAMLDTANLAAMGEEWMRLPLTATAQAEPKLVFLLPAPAPSAWPLWRAIYAAEPAYRGAIAAIGKSQACAWFAAEALPAAPDQAAAALFIAQYALAQVWRGWGLQPQASLGAGLGAGVAAVLEGRLSLEAALQLAAAGAKPDGADLAAGIAAFAAQSLFLSIGAAPAPPPLRCIASLGAAAAAPEAGLALAAGELWLAGANLDWRAFAQGENRRRLALPTYPFERQRYWIEPQAPNAQPPRFPNPQRMHLPS
jgi:acyl transferase domain-containing protein